MSDSLCRWNIRDIQVKNLTDPGLTRSITIPGPDPGLTVLPMGFVITPDAMGKLFEFVITPETNPDFGAIAGRKGLLRDAKG